MGFYFQSQSSTCHQWVDGHELDFDGFVAHLKAQRQRIESVKFTFKSVVEQGDKVATIHLIDAVTKDSHPVKGKVVAQFTFEDGKIVNCEELTYFSEAREQDRDLGSVS